MSPRKTISPPSASARSGLTGFYSGLGTRLSETCRNRRWNAQRLADESGVSRGLVYLALRGQQVSLEAIYRMVTALGLKLEWDLVDPRRKSARPRQDIVHSAMGEFEAAHLRRQGYVIAIDEPYQHYQFAGRADLVAWDLATHALLHIENRTRFPDLQEVAGSFNAKRAYLAESLAKRIGIANWRSETHVIAALWSAEVLHSLRLRTETFRSLCPNDDAAFQLWWAGTTPATGKSATLIVMDPTATGRQRPVISLEDALTARPRHAGYGEAAAKLTGRSTNSA